MSEQKQNWSEALAARDDLEQYGDNSMVSLHWHYGFVWMIFTV